MCVRERGEEGRKTKGGRERGKEKIGNGGRRGRKDGGSKGELTFIKTSSANAPTTANRNVQATNI